MSPMAQAVLAVFMGNFFLYGVSIGQDFDSAQEIKEFQNRLDFEKKLIRITAIRQIRTKGQDGYYHTYFNVVFAGTKKAVGYNIYSNWECPNDVCEIYVNDFSKCGGVNYSECPQKIKKIDTPNLNRVSSVQSSDCFKGNCYSIGNYEEAGGTLYIKVCGVFEGGEETCSDYKTFVYDGLNGGH